MNERIKLLVKQAEQYAIDKANEGTDEDFDYSFDDDFQEKFADLIVRECQYRVEQYINECGEIASLPDTVIMKHFGVEEK